MWFVLDHLSRYVCDPVSAAIMVGRSGSVFRPPQCVASWLNAVSAAMLV